MTSKIENLKDLEYYSNYETLANILLAWSNKKKNKELDEAIRCLTQVAFYVNNLQTDRWTYTKCYNEFRSDKLRAVERARRSDNLAEKLLAENDKLKKIVNL
jgi:hypothetical protein